MNEEERNNNSLIPSPEHADDDHDEENELTDPNDDNDRELEAEAVPRGRRRRQSKHQKRLENRIKREEKKELYSAALEDMKNNVFKSQNSCAKHYGINQSTLSKMIANGTEFVPQGGKLTEFTWEEEVRISQHITRMLELGFGLTIAELSPLFQEAMTSLLEADRNRTTKWEHNMPPYSFVYNFTRRHDLTLRNSMEISKARSIISPESLQLWQRDTEKGKEYRVF